MKYINDEHQELTTAQQSGVMDWVRKIEFDRRVAIAVVALVSGITSSAMAWQGSSSPRIYFCLDIPAGEICRDKNDRKFRMTPYHWNQWELAGMSRHIVRDEIFPATNPYKPLQAAWGFTSFAVAGWLLRQFQHDENQKSKLDAIAKKRDEAIAELNTQIELLEVARDFELSATDNAVIIQQAELLGEAEVKLTQMETAEMLFNAETAGMTEEQKTDYVDFVRNQQTPYLSGTQTLGKTIDPKDKVNGKENKSIEGDWVSHAVNHGCVLIWGGQHGGKTTAAGHIIKARKMRGDRVIVLDPHAEKGQWEGLELIGAGMDYKAIDDFMAWYFDECIQRYKLLRDEGSAAVHRRGQICLVAEELTNYAKRCKNSADFTQSCLSDNRKIFFNCLLISHGRSLLLTGGSQGTSKTRDDSFLELHCIPPTEGSPRRWEIKYPGGEFTQVQIPDWEIIFNFANRPKPPDRKQLEDIWNLEFNLEPSEPPFEPLNRPDSNTFSDKTPRFSRFNLTRSQCLEMINSLRTELNQTQIIELLWACRKGGSAAWRNAVQQFREVTGDGNDLNE